MKKSTFEFEKWPASGNMDILSLLLPVEVLESLCAIAMLLPNWRDREFILPSKQQIKKMLVHKDMKLVEEGKMTVDEVRMKYSIDGWAVNRLYKQRKKEIEEEKKDVDQYLRIRRYAQAIEKAGILRSKKPGSFEKRS